LQGPAQLRDLPRGQRPGWQLFQGAESDAIGLAQGAIDGSGFGHAHLGVVEDEGGDVTGMGIAIADEAAAVGRRIDGGLEDPKVFLGATQGQHRLNLDTGTAVPRCQPEQFGVSDVSLCLK